jgi:hypothetical protein
MKNWTNQKRKALKSVVGALAKRVGLARRSSRFPIPVSSKAAQPALIPLQTSSNGQEHNPPLLANPSTEPPWLLKMVSRSFSRD